MKITNLPIPLIDRVRAQNPVVLTVANSVTAGKVADALSASGVSPIMSQAPEEATAMVNLADAITINLGTIDQAQLTLIRAIMDANAGQRPVVLDPVAAQHAAGLGSWQAHFFDELIQLTSDRFAAQLNYGKDDNNDE